MPVPKGDDSNSLNAQAIAVQNAKAMRKMLVNAQITAIFSVIEIISNLTFHFYISF